MGRDVFGKSKWKGIARKMGHLRAVLSGMGDEFRMEYRSIIADMKRYGMDHELSRYGLRLEGAL